MKPIIYYKEVYKGMTCFVCDTDFSKYEYSPDLTFYKKGWFREHENESVIMVTDVMKPQTDRHKYFYFQTRKEGEKFIKDFIKERKAKLKKRV